MNCLNSCNCCKSSKDSTLELRRSGEGTTSFFRCKSSSKVERKERNRGTCGIGCFLICESTAKDINSSETKRCCCFPCKRSSEEDEKSKGVKNICCLHCFRPCKDDSSKKGKGGTCNCFGCCHDRSKENDSSNKGKGSSWCCFHSDSGRRSTKASGKKIKERSTNKSKEKSSRKRGKRVMCCCGSCCSRTLEERRPTTRRCEKILRCFCCINTGNGNADMMKREHGFCLCWHSKQKEEKGNHLAALVYNLSFNSDSGRKNRLAAEEILQLGNGNIASRVFTYKELLAATNNFRKDSLLGSGGFGRVYKGQLPGTNEVIAVKQLDRKGYQGSREFLIEVLMLGLLHHPNLVKLLGYCAEEDQRILVYEYMPFGSLQDLLLDMLPNKNPLDWATRMKIAFGAAKGLEHLHDVANPPVIYRDMKASNILLDEKYNPKLSDFGLAKLGPVGDKTHVSTRVMGTYGYCAPEYALTGQLTKMSDVYSYGVLLLELITGRKAIDITRRKDEQHLVNWAAPLFKDKKRFIGMADPLLDGNFPMKGLYQALSVANMCLQREASTRPLISDVVTAIEYLANPRPILPEIFGEPVPQQLSSSHHERTSTEIFSFDERKDESLGSTNMSFGEDRHERVGSTNMSIDEGNHERTRTANFLSFDEETFQSLSSDTESLREEDI